MAEDVECRRCGQTVRQTVRVDTPEGYRRLCLPCFEVLGDWINGTGAELACPVWSCRERFHSHHDETAATSLLYHLEAEHEWLIDFLSGKLGGAELRTDGGIESSDSYRTFHVTLRAEVQRGRLDEWLSANIPPGVLVDIEEVGPDQCEVCGGDVEGHPQLTPDGHPHGVNLLVGDCCIDLEEPRPEFDADLFETGDRDV